MYFNGCLCLFSWSSFYSLSVTYLSFRYLIVGCNIFFSVFRQYWRHQPKLPSFPYQNIIPNLYFLYSSLNFKIRLSMFYKKKKTMLINLNHSMKMMQFDKTRVELWKNQTDCYKAYTLYRKYIVMVALYLLCMSMIPKKGQYIISKISSNLEPLNWYDFFFKFQYHQMTLRTVCVRFL